MKRKIIKLGLVAVMLLLFAGIASAGDLPPPIPADYSGNILVNGAPNGSKVLAQVVNDTGYVYQTSIFDIVSGRYGKLVNGNPLLVSPPDETFNGKTIKFYVKTDGKYCKANQEDTFSQGKTENSFNLTVTGSCVEPLPTSKDTTAPVITRLGTNPVSVQVGSVYTDAGATAFDNYDGDITASIVTVNPVNTTVKGTYNVTYNVKDSSNNAAVQVTRTVNVVDKTTTDNSRSSSSGGGGGGGVTSGENYSNIAKSETKDGSLTAGKPVAFTFKTPELAIHQILITGKENENDVSVKVEHLKNKSSLVSKPAPGTVYINENVWANSKKITAVTLKFRVTNAWITGSNVQKETIKLLRWSVSDKDWKALDTTVLTKDDTYTYFEAQSAGLSSFAVSAVKEGQVPVETAASPGTTDTTPISNTSTPKKPTPGFGLLAAVLVVSAIYMLRRREG